MSERESSSNEHAVQNASQKILKELNKKSKLCLLVTHYNAFC